MTDDHKVRDLPDIRTTGTQIRFLVNRAAVIAAAAEAAWGAHYCKSWARDKSLCHLCKTGGRETCFELDGGFDQNDSDWVASGEAAVATIEQMLGIKIGAET